MNQSLPIEPKKPEVKESNVKESSSPKAVKTNNSKPTLKEQLQVQKAQASPSPVPLKAEEPIT